MNVIITGGDSNFFKFLKKFVESLRKKALYKEKIIICDYVMKNRRFVEENSFSNNELNFFKNYDVEVISFYELLEKNNISRELIDMIHTQHNAYPFKFIYCCLISKDYLKKAENIYFFDADCYFQKPIDPIFNQFKKDRISVAPELIDFIHDPCMGEHIKVSDFSLLGSNSNFIDKMYDSPEFNTGFFGGKSEIFNKFTSLCWMLSTNNLIKFHSDQPLVNILKSYFHYPMDEISNKFIYNISYFQNRVTFDKINQIFKCNSSIPLVVRSDGPSKFLFKCDSFIPFVIHFNGPSRCLFDKYLSKEKLRRKISRIGRRCIRKIIKKY